MPIVERHGRQGQPTEYYEWEVVRPKIVVTKAGEYWVVAVHHTDNSWQASGDHYSLTEARAIAERLAKWYGAMRPFGVTEDRRLASNCFMGTESIVSVAVTDMETDDNPYEHDSSDRGCQDGCEACTWDTEHA